MKIFANKSIWKKLVIVILFITVFSFVAPEPVEAATLGGELMKPICQFVLGIGDGVVSVLQSAIVSQSVSFITVKTNIQWWKVVLGVLAIIVGLAAIVALSLVPGTLGFVITALVMVGKLVAGGFALGGLYFAYSGSTSESSEVIETDDVIATMLWADEAFEAEKSVTLPLIVMSPEEIFRNEIPLFDVNFFDPNTDTYVSEYSFIHDTSDDTVTENWSLPDDFDESNPIADSDHNQNGGNGTTVIDDLDSDLGETGKFNEITGIDGTNTKLSTTNLEIKSKFYIELNYTSGSTTYEYGYYFFNADGGTYCIRYGTETTTWSSGSGNSSGSSTEQYTAVYYSNNVYSSKEEIYTGNSSSTGSESIEGETSEDYVGSSITYRLSETISSWYYRLLIIATVGMLSVLVYIGIRILISSTASDKAKYKQMIGDWLIGMVLLFTMHYIMVFANTFVDLLTDFLSSTGTGTYFIWVQNDNERIGEDLVKNYGFEIEELNDIENEATVKSQVENASAQTVFEYSPGDGSHYYLWTTNMMGKLRIDSQTYTDDTLKYVGYTVLYVMMVIYLIMFIVIYIKRVIYMAFLTLIAPLVALTYPIDKASDGSAQGFNYWFKEYMFNLLLQPLHLLLYTILVSSALEFAMSNPLYAIVTLGFMVPAEKILRQMFNFGKAQTPGVFGGVAGAAVVMSGMRWLTGHGPNGGKGGKGGKDGDKQETDANGKPFLSTGGNKVDVSELSESGASNSGLDSGDNTPTSQNSSWESGRSESSLTGDSYDSTSAIGGYGYQYDLGEGYDEGTFQMPSTDINDALPENKPEEKSGDTTQKVEPEKQKRSLRRGLGDAIVFYARGQGKKLERNIKNAKPIRKIAGVAGGAAMGMVGLAAGATSGDFSKAVQYAGVGAAGGYKLSSGIAGAAGNAVGVDGTAASLQRGYLGEEEYQKRMALEYQKRQMEDAENIKRVQEKFKMDRKEAEELLQRMIPFYSDNKVSNLDDMLKMEKTVRARIAQKGESEEEAREHAYIGWNTNNRYALGSNIGPGKVEATARQISKDYGITIGQAYTMIDDAGMHRQANEKI